MSWQEKRSRDREVESPKMIDIQMYRNAHRSARLGPPIADSSSGQLGARERERERKKRGCCI